MANALGKQLRFPWQITGASGTGGEPVKGWFSMKLGTFQYLFPAGVPGQNATGFTDVLEQEPKTYQRQLYPGGPSITVERTQKTVVRTRSNRATLAKSEKKLILSEVGLIGASSDTIHYTGPTYGAVAWLKAYSNIVTGSGVQIAGPHGQAYGTLDPAVELPAA